MHDGSSHLDPERSPKLWTLGHAPHDSRTGKLDDHRREPARYRVSSNARSAAGSTTCQVAQAGLDRIESELSKLVREVAKLGELSRAGRTSSLERVAKRLKRPRRSF